ncbi:MAG: NINE protein [Desulfobulbaceae bacterium]|nr:MAG: NINE protein [Desulfobulbaceae bacterium]
MQTAKTHEIFVGYFLWIFGFLGAHRFYYGRQISGTIYFFTLGLFFIGWIIDLFLIPSMNRSADYRFIDGPVDYNVAWLLLTFLGVFGVHRMYCGKWLTGIVYLCTVGLFGVGIVYDFWTLNSQISEINHVKNKDGVIG